MLYFFQQVLNGLHSGALYALLAFGYVLTNGILHRTNLAYGAVFTMGGVDPVLVGMLEQVGQTGSRISPDLYIPCGISGAIQHWVGCSSAKTILAINSDPDAPMVTKAHYAVIGDLHKIVPAINEELRRRRA